MQELTQDLEEVLLGVMQCQASEVWEAHLEDFHPYQQQQLKATVSHQIAEYLNKQSVKEASLQAQARPDSPQAQEPPTKEASPQDQARPDSLQAQEPPTREDSLQARQPPTREASRQALKPAAKTFFLVSNQVLAPMLMEDSEVVLKLFLQLFPKTVKSPMDQILDPASSAFTATILKESNAK